MNSIELTAPAKVNLFLKVLNKRPDGYHDIATLFERIALCDTIKITKIPRGIVLRTDRRITARPEENIAYKAARLILDHAKVGGGVRLELKKRIPVAAGLGGGSSDAAAVLIGIRILYGLNISHRIMMRLGAELGADVPFFLLDKPFAVGRDRGEALTPVDLKQRLWHLLIYPGHFKASTRDIYRAFDRSDLALTRNTTDAKIILPKNWKGLESLLHNDLGDVVAKSRPVIGKTIQCLAASLGKTFIVSGSGPSLFCLYRTRREAIEAKDKLFSIVPAGKRRLWQAFIVGTRT